jgi:hypothetical protein
MMQRHDMACERLPELARTWANYASGRLDEVGRRAVAEHLSSCERCNSYFRRRLALQEAGASRRRRDAEWAEIGTDEATREDFVSLASAVASRRRDFAVRLAVGQGPASADMAEAAAGLFVARTAEETGAGWVLHISSGNAARLELDVARLPVEAHLIVVRLSLHKNVLVRLQQLGRAARTLTFDINPGEIGLRGMHPLCLFPRSPDIAALGAGTLSTFVVMGLAGVVWCSVE